MYATTDNRGLSLFFFFYIDYKYYTLFKCYSTVNSFLLLDNRHLPTYLYIHIPNNIKRAQKTNGNAVNYDSQ